MALYYPYDPELGYYLGNPVEAETQPENSSEWEPKSVTGFRPWFDGVGWQLIVCLKTTGSLDVAKDELYGILSNAYFKNDPKYGSRESASWDRQRTEAEQFKKDGTIGPYLDALSKSEESVEVLVDKILEKALEYDIQYSTFLADLISTRSQISNATKFEELPDPVVLTQKFT